MNNLFDRFGRCLYYLRISVTDRCNLRCMYCLPGKGVACGRASDILTYEEITAIVRSVAPLGVRKIRITGGEPLVRNDILHLVTELGKIDGIDDISLTTNGIFLSACAEGLKKAGLKRINISLDTLRRERFKQITGSDGLAAVWEGIEKSLAVGFRPVKINVVVLRGVNDDELLDIARLTRAWPLDVRFIEFMPIGSARSSYRDRFLAQGDIVAAWKKEEIVEAVPVTGGTNISAAYRLKDAAGTISFISPISRSFCHQCSRLRLTSHGKLKPCLGSGEEIDLKSLVRSDGCTPERLREAFAQAAAVKPRGHCFGAPSAAVEQEYSMCQIGG